MLDAAYLHATLGARPKNKLRAAASPPISPTASPDMNPYDDQDASASLKPSFEDPADVNLPQDLDAASFSSTTTPEDSLGTMGLFGDPGQLEDDSIDAHSTTSSSMADVEHDLQTSQLRLPSRSDHYDAGPAVLAWLPSDHVDTDRPQTAPHDAEHLQTAPCDDGRPQTAPHEAERLQADAPYEAERPQTAPNEAKHPQAAHYAAERPHQTTHHRQAAPSRLSLMGMPLSSAEGRHPRHATADPPDGDPLETHLQAILARVVRMLAACVALSRRAAFLVGASRQLSRTSHTGNAQLPPSPSPSPLSAAADAAVLKGMPFEKAIYFESPRAPPVRVAVAGESSVEQQEAPSPAPTTRARAPSPARGKKPPWVVRRTQEAFWNAPGDQPSLCTAVREPMYIKELAIRRRGYPPPQRELS